ncbi:MAG: hypothetical protein WCG42_07120 [Parachlamydiaceae bacterium]
MTSVAPISDHTRNAIAYNNSPPPLFYPPSFIVPMPPGWKQQQEDQRACCDAACKQSSCYKNVTYVTATIAALLIIPGAALRATGSNSAGAALLTIGGLVGAIALSTFAAFCIKRCQGT